MALRYSFNSPFADVLDGYSDMLGAIAEGGFEDDEEVRCDFCSHGTQELLTPEGFPICLDCANDRARGL